jgi:hypothetical protein
MRGDPSTSDTKDLKVCLACRTEAREQDRFCRHCGASHSATLVSRTSNNLTSGSLNYGNSSPRYNTFPLAPAKTYRCVSRSLVNIVTIGVSANAAGYLDNHLIRRVILALLLIPIWLIIILLSPLDAYATAKTIAEGDQKGLNSEWL